MSKTPGTTGIGQLVIDVSGAKSTINLSTLPPTTPLPQESGVQIVTESGVPLTYSPTTLHGYEDITQPIEISSSFVEGVNGQTTTQGGFWLIGPHGVIVPPRDIGGGFGIHLPDGGLPDGTTGLPGYPGGP